MKNLYIELADSPFKRERGLMYRKRLARNGGMLFKFASPEYHRFWMQNTYIPLDIAFVDDDGKILQIETMAPMSTRAVASAHSCRYALEVNKGWFKSNGIKVGDRIDGYGIKGYKKIAQLTPDSMQGQVPQQPPQPDPNIMLNKTTKQKLEEADRDGKSMIVIYHTKSQKTLPPKTISPPFTFEADAGGRHDGVVKVWDEQTAGWKSLLIDNIISLEPEEAIAKIPKKQEGNPELDRKDIGVLKV
jgi:uncharacterized membrane protein (UPF0127 family)